MSEQTQRPEPYRERLPATRLSITHKFQIAASPETVEGFFTIGLYDDGRPGELFLAIDKEGTITKGMADAWGTCVSLCWQYGVPVETLMSKFAHWRFEPSGMTADPDIKIAKSIIDYISRWILGVFVEGTIKIPGVPNPKKGGIQKEKAEPHKMIIEPETKQKTQQGE